MQSGQITETVQTVSTLVEDISDIHGQDFAEVNAAAEAAVTAAVEALAEALADDEQDVTESVEAVASEAPVCESFDASPVGQPPQGTMIGADDKVSKKDLVQLLEGFVRIIKTDEQEGASATGTGIEISSPRGMVVSETRVDDRTVEIDQLRGLVIEAQDTIIKLLTDRVDDRSRIATLEAQLALLPDLQAQADRAMSVAVRTEEYRTELTKMKFELDRFRLFRVRIEGEQRKGTVWNRIQKWLFSRPNAADETLQRGEKS
ncbi:MAG: hypothetical protein JST01_14210 [Cyanobacteria bacterium SZAS TMP-1]|nr:hypothetical protein [Cyanobacteria bacterium SZAS TMP-1]